MPHLGAEIVQRHLPTGGATPWDHFGAISWALISGHIPGGLGGFNILGPAFWGDTLGTVPKLAGDPKLRQTHRLGPTFGATGVARVDFSLVG